MGKILLFQVNVMKEGAIHTLCTRLGHTVVSVKREQYGGTIGALAGLVDGQEILSSGTGAREALSFGTDKTAANSPSSGTNKTVSTSKAGSALPVELADEMMVLAGLSPEELELFLTEYKKAGIPPIPHKAVLTPYNQNWTVKQLFEDLDEHVAKFK